MGVKIMKMYIRKTKNSFSTTLYKMIGGKLHIVMETPSGGGITKTKYCDHDLQLRIYDWEVEEIQDLPYWAD